MWDALWHNGKVATMTAGAPFGLVEAGAVAAQDGRIAWVGRGRRAAGRPRRVRARPCTTWGAASSPPALIDPHNHAVYYGDALADFELLTQGGSRADMIASGGGVGGLVRQTRGGQRRADLRRVRRARSPS